MATTDQLPGLPFARTDVLDIAPLFRRLQAEMRVTQVRTAAGDPAWLITRYDDVRSLLNDERLGRSHPEPRRAARFANSAFMDGAMGKHETEKADHWRVRRALNPSFTPRRMKALEPRVAAIVDDLLSRLARRTPPVDLHEEFSFPVPVLVICELLGVPYEDRNDFRRWSEQLANLYDREGAAAALGRLNQYMRGLVDRKRERPEEDVISDLIAMRDERGALTESEVVQMSAGLLFAGHETTVARIDFGTLLLITNPEQRDALRADPALVPLAVEEILRFAAPSQGVLLRYASADIAIGDVTIPAGDAVLLAIEPANRDGATFTQPDRFDVRREPNPHLGFGHGPHYCTGASLARVELQAVFGALFQRFPGLRLAVPPDQLRLRSHVLTGGLEALPVTW